MKGQKVDGQWAATFPTTSQGRSFNLSIPWAPYESLRESQGGKQYIFDTNKQNRDVGSGKSLQINNSS